MQAVVLATELVDLLSDDVPDVAEAACYALGELGTSAEPEDAGWAATVVTALVSTVVSHREPLCREAAVAALGELGFPEGLPAVLAAMGDKPAVRRRATVALASFDGDEVGAALARAAQDPDWQVRQAAEDLLGRRPPG
jgi:HEAT repeat protein